MVMLITASVLAIFILILITLQKTYNHLPTKELKRQARYGDPTANIVYRAVAYGDGLRLFLWGLTGLALAGFMVLTSRALPAWLALICILGLLFISSVWFSLVVLGKISLKITEWLTPPLTATLERIHPLTSRLNHFLKLQPKASNHPHIYEKEDLIDLLDSQKKAAHNRISEDELDMAAHVLSFGDKMVRDFMTPRRKARMVRNHETIGPILIDELHKTGLSHFPVTDGPTDKVIGTLFLSDLIKLPEGGVAEDFMDKKVYYAHEEQSLSDILQAFLSAKHPVFVVLNNQEEIVGTINIDDVLQQIMKRKIDDDFDQYDNPRAVAAWGIAKKHMAHKPKEETAEEKEAEEPPEVIE